jgi:peptide/nickel transport system permease protein
MALREREFVQAARAMGIPTARALCRHSMPNTLSSVIVLATLQTTQTILAEAALSFLGLGTGQTYPSWGQMIALGLDYVNVAWWLSTFPGIAILLTVLAINLIGDRVRDILDPCVT